MNSIVDFWMSRLISHIEMLSDDRGIGISEALHGLAQDPVLVFFALLTQLGDVWFLFLLGGVHYVAGDRFPKWGIDRRRGLFVLGLLLTYVALVGVLKQSFMVPRPPGAETPPDVQWIPSALQGVFASISTGTGYGFPSGHALGSTLVWGGFALAVRKDKRSHVWLALAGVVILIVSLSRVVLGVHYLVDVVVGTVIGIVVLGGLYTISDHGTTPGRVLVFAAGIGVLGLIHGVTFDSVAAVGSAVGAWLTWRAVGDLTPAHPLNRREVVVGFAVFGLAGGFFALLNSLKPSLPITFFGATIAVGGVVGAPLIGNRFVEQSEGR
ncbi:phosphatase PAP2 family protein [Halosolutus gelatinilyticus]|uniref:phosphatase PAP2 family protein n=1 Tax=Halosolutus gelatinilyticus TaxID=2931975 RepID=UPI001FF397B2|nr:phosphatase PAP2 family protein [Halosolutus gelatinilyticus]